jgi:hypothetical protein
VLVSKVIIKFGRQKIINPQKDPKEDAKEVPKKEWIVRLTALWCEIGGSDWAPVSRAAAIGWTLFFLAFLVYAATNSTGFLFIDSANLVVHEGGHLLFGWFGSTFGLWGGTILQWAVPLLLAAYFFTQRQTTAYAFSLFFFFENWLYTATYMADARAMVLPLVTTGDPDFVEHDWHTIFTSLGVLPYDTTIAGIVRFGGWCGMIATVAWLVWRAKRSKASGS